jgi:hypothetical protein
MARQTAEEDWNDDDSSDDDSTVLCPYCQREIYEDTLRCPHCENYISAEDSPPVPKTRFVIVGTLAALAVIYWWITH